MAAQYIKTLTIAGDRWDLLAWRYYGDPGGYIRILEANPQVAAYPVLPIGTPIYVPVIPPAMSTAPLSPWIAQAQAMGQLP
jgi:phage tail protein X